MPGSVSVSQGATLVGVNASLPEVVPGGDPLAAMRSDVSTGPSSYVREYNRQNPNLNDVGSYTPVSLVQESGGGWLKTYTGTYGRGGSSNVTDVYTEKIQEFNSQGQLLKQELFGLQPRSNGYTVPTLLSTINYQTGQEHDINRGPTGLVQQDIIGNLNTGNFVKNPLPSSNLSPSQAMNVSAQGQPYSGSGYSVSAPTTIAPMIVPTPSGEERYFLPAGTEYPIMRNGEVTYGRLPSNLMMSESVFEHFKGMTWTTPESTTGGGLDLVTPGESMLVKGGTGHLIVASQPKGAVTETLPTTPDLSVFGFDTGVPSLSASLKGAVNRMEYAGFKGYSEGDFATGAGLLLGSVAVGVAEVPLTLLEHPVKSVESTASSLLHPVKAAESMLGNFQVNPGETVGEVLGMVAVGKVGESVTGFVGENVKFEVMKLPGDEGLVEAYRGVGFGKQPLVGLQNGKIVVGTPDVIETLKGLPAGQDVKVSTPMFTRIIETTAQSNPGEFVDVGRATELIKAQRGIVGETLGVKSSYQTGFVTETERLSAPGVKILLDVAKENQGVVSGSFSRSADLAPTYQVGGETFLLNKVPRDVDIHLDGIAPERIAAIAQETTQRLQSAGYNARLVGEGGLVKNAIEVEQSGGGFAKVTEFLGKGTEVPGEEVPDFVVGYRKVGEPEVLGGVKKTTLSEELRGVVQGVTRVTKGEGGKLDLFPPENRLKDVGSEVVAARTLLQSKPNAALRGHIETFESLFPEELVREQLAAPSERVVADFSQRGESATPTSGGVRVPFGSPVRFTISGVDTSVRVVSDMSASFSARPNGYGGFSASSSPSQSPSRLSSPSLGASPSPSPRSSSSSYPSSSPSESPSASPSLFPSPSPSPSSSPSLYPSTSPSSSPSPSVSPFPSGSPISPPPLPPAFVVPQSSNYPLRKKLFNVLVRKRGKFVRSNAQPLELSNAVSLGRRVVEGSIAASFEVQGEESPGLNVDVGSGLSPRLYTRSKRSPNVFVQRRGTRLGSAGERRDIQTAKRFGGFRYQKTAG